MSNFFLSEFLSPTPNSNTNTNTNAASYHRQPYKYDQRYQPGYFTM